MTVPHGMYYSHLRNGVRNSSIKYKRPITAMGFVDHLGLCLNHSFSNIFLRKSHWFKPLATLYQL